MSERKFKVGDIVNIRTNILEVDNNTDTDLIYKIRTGPGRALWVGESILGNKTYEQGLEEGWELAEKVMNMSFKERDTILHTNAGHNGIDDILENFTATQVKEKIEKYEELASFDVGDLVEVNGYLKGVVTYVYTDGNIDILLGSGITRTHEQPSNCRKLGKCINVNDMLCRICTK